MTPTGPSPTPAPPTSERVDAATAHLVTAARVIHSGKTRARQTAEIWAETLSVQAEAAGGLAPGDDPAIWADGVGDEDLMLVGHLPHSVA